jgi:hypothetical protein
MLNSDDEQDNQSKKREIPSTLPMQSEEIKESLGIKSGGAPATTAAAGSKLQDDYMRLCQMSGGNGTTVNNNKTKPSHLSTIPGK